MSDTEESVLTIEAAGDHIQVWTLNRPRALNSFNRALLDAVNAALDGLLGSDVRCVVLAGAGGKAFSAGADLKERKTMPAEEVPGFVSLIGSTFHRISTAAPPFIAAVSGYALGGGCEIALACDLRAVDSGAVLALPETGLAIIPGAGGTQRLSRLVGLGRAKELVFTGRRVRAEEALAIGMAEIDGRESTSLDAALACAHTIASKGPVAIAAAKVAVERGFDLPLAEGLVHERACYDLTIPTRDRLEALSAFAEKRPPSFEGR
jgi:enoyl-CoA hydratase/carnithine racemase